MTHPLPWQGGFWSWIEGGAFPLRATIRPGIITAIPSFAFFPLSPLACAQVAGWILELDRGQGIPFEGEYSAWLMAGEGQQEQRKRPLPQCLFSLVHSPALSAGGRVAGWILELDRGQGIPFEGNYSAWLENKAQRLAGEERQEQQHSPLPQPPFSPLRLHLHTGGRVAGWILELDRGQGIPFEGNYSAWLENKAQRLGTEERQQSALQRVMEREMEWIRQKAKGQQKKGKARMRAYEELVIQAGQYSREEKLESMFLPPGPRLGDVVVEAEGVAKAFGERVLMDGVNFTLPPGGIVGVIGGNGAGKSTLFRMIVGQDSPNEGTLRVGETVAPLYVDQSRDALDPNKTVFEEITGGADEILLGERKVNSRAYCAWYNFKGADQQKKVGVLSGGERNRVHLARIMRRGGNLLMLDEPTNDLDVDTLRALEDAIQGFAGCVIVISHDRWFLDRIATHIMAFEGDSKDVFGGLARCMMCKF
ncbi:unnamed protein product [Closterium sp. Naga37s-1]|nr:unnamed protein product [Closterium sp. Naga37s-1]